MDKELRLMCFYVNVLMDKKGKMFIEERDVEEMISERGCSPNDLITSFFAETKKIAKLIRKFCQEFIDKKITELELEEKVFKLGKDGLQ